MWFVMSRVTRSPMGRTFRAIRDDHVVAAALGKNVFWMQLKSMLIGSFYAGIGGGLLIQFGGSFNPTAWLPGETFVVFAVLIVGGAGNNIGMFVGALLVETLLVHLPAFLPEIPGHPGLIEYFDLALVGIVLMAMLWFRPQGVVPERLRRAASFGVVERLRRRPASWATASRRHERDRGARLRSPDRADTCAALRGHHEGVPGRARRQRRRLRHSRRADHCAHRPERRRQDDGRQHPLRRDALRQRQGVHRRDRGHQLAQLQDRAARPDADVPALPRARRADGPREPARRTRPAGG